MGRGTRIGSAITASLLAVIVAVSAAYGVLQLADVTATTSGAQNQAQDDARSDDSQEVVSSPTLKAKPEPKPLFDRGDRGVGVRELQSRLKQLEWYAPDITGTYDRVTAQAVLGFQGKRGFEKTGTVERRTWKRVVAMSRKPTDDEMHNRLTPGPRIMGPGDSSAEVRELQARLKQIAWFTPDVTDYYGETTTAAVSGFQVKREIPSTGEVDQRTLDRLLEMTTEPTEDELLNREPTPVPVASGSALDPRCLTGRALCIDKSSNSLQWVIDGSVQTTVEVRFGSDELPTDEGEFYVSYKSIDHVSSLYDTPMPYAMFFSGGQAVHYSPDFAATGYSGASHGCVNVRDYAAIQSLFDQVGVGDKVVVHWS